jgi:hypothetical protein
LLLSSFVSAAAITCYIVCRLLRMLLPV